MAEYQRNSPQKSLRDLSKDQSIKLQRWVRTLQLALGIEADHGFKNILGRIDYFHSFIYKELKSPITSLLPVDIKKRLSELSGLFFVYSSTSESKRRRLVVDTRQVLHRLNKEIDSLTVVNKTTLNVVKKTSIENLQSKTNVLGLNIDSNLIDVNGIGLKIADKLSELGILTIRDLILYFPRDYVDYSSLLNISDLELGQTATIVAKVKRCSSFISPKNNNLSILNLQLKDSSGHIKVTKFFAGKRLSNRSYLKSQERLYPIGVTVAVSGLVKDGPYGRTLNEPIIEVLENKNSILKSKSIGRLLSIYSLTEGLTSQRFRNLIEIVLPFASKFREYLSSTTLSKLNFPKKNEALFEIHCPTSTNSLKQARRRLVFDEFFFFQLNILRRRNEMRKLKAPYLNVSKSSNGLVGKFINSLPFSLTNAQRRVFNEIKSDLALARPMSRLVQGDVGSGKTIVAIASLLSAIEAGWQGALMAPTEVLASQHYSNLCKWLPPLHVNVELLTGSTSRSKRRELLNNLSCGALNLLVGTHALLEDAVTFFRLGLVVVDEQHRFGVEQRNRLLTKGLQPHLLSMTATPIPRTLALSIYGDLDVSQIDELPPGRTAVETKVFSTNKISVAYEKIRTEVSFGHQAYVILPLIEESDKLDLKAAIGVHNELSKIIFPDLSVGLLHGRMSNADKQEVINKFRSNQCNVLVSTTVVEVGVDVPNATIMIINNADRFGLSQLHQLRGRIGRGSSKSYCLLVYDGSNKMTKQRLDVMTTSNDGFEISEIDLRFRGPGHVLGTRQSGLPDFVLANLIDDTDVMELARSEANNILSSDPELKENPLLLKLLLENSSRINQRAQLN